MLLHILLLEIAMIKTTSWPLPNIREKPVTGVLNLLWLTYFGQYVNILHHENCLKICSWTINKYWRIVNATEYSFIKYSISWAPSGSFEWAKTKLMGKQSQVLLHMFNCRPHCLCGYCNKFTLLVYCDDKTLIMEDLYQNHIMYKMSIIQDTKCGYQRPLCFLYTWKVLLF